MLWFTSDTHFGHKNIIKYCDRPFNSVEEMDRVLIENWNDTVGEDDAVIHLGDFSFHDEQRSAEILNQLNGSKSLLIGNHDRKPICGLDGWDNLAHGFTFLTREDVDDDPENEWLRDIPLIAMLHGHEPCENCGTSMLHDHLKKGKEYIPPGTVTLHGHTHSKNRVTVPGLLNVGVDAWDYAPVSLRQLVETYRESMGPQMASNTTVH